MALISRLLVPGLSGAEIWDEGQAIALHPDENIYVAGSADKRRRDFALGRAAARAALAGLGHGNDVIARAGDGAPRWPRGILGSITHTKGYAAALIGASRDFANVGIDAERTGAVTEDLWPRLFSSAELERLLKQADPMLAATLLFCAKEASYKAGAQKGVLAFREIEVSLDADKFVAAGRAARLIGRLDVQNGVVLAAAWHER